MPSVEAFLSQSATTLREAPSCRKRVQRILHSSWLKSVSVTQSAAASEWVSQLESWFIVLPFPGKEDALCCGARREFCGIRRDLVMDFPAALDRHRRPAIPLPMQREKQKSTKDGKLGFDWSQLIVWLIPPPGKSVSAGRKMRIKSAEINSKLFIPPSVRITGEMGTMCRPVSGGKSI